MAKIIDSCIRSPSALNGFGILPIRLTHSAMHDQVRTHLRLTFAINYEPQPANWVQGGRIGLKEKTWIAASRIPTAY